MEECLLPTALPAAEMHAFADERKNNILFASSKIT